MGVILARMGQSVILVAADSVDSRLQCLLGINEPAPAAGELVDGRVPAEAVLLQSPEPRLRLLGRCGEYLDNTSGLFGRREKLIKAISALPADYILVEAADERSDGNLDLFNNAKRRMLVATPEPRSVQDAYGFIRAALLRLVQRRLGAVRPVALAVRQLREAPSPQTMGDLKEALAAADPEAGVKFESLLEEYRPLLIVNRADDEQDSRVAEILGSVCRRLLNIHVAARGPLSEDPALSAAASLMSEEVSHSRAWRQISRLVEEMAEGQNAAAESDSRPAVIGLNDNLEFLGRVLHIQTEDVGEGQRAVTTHVFCGGRVLFGKRTEYPADARGRQGRERVAELMRRQHFEVIQELESKRSDAARNS
jgi:flagellar biosynthesis protein FlhG